MFSGLKRNALLYIAFGLLYIACAFTTYSFYVYYT